MGDPTDLFAYDEIARVLKRDIEVAVVSESQLHQTIDRIYRRTEEISGLAKKLEQDIGDTYVDFGVLSANLSVEEAPVVKLLQSMFEDATQVNASDIHIEPQESRVLTRFRIDGVLVPQNEADIRIGPAMVLRLKLMASLDISEKRLPQDGRFAVIVRDQPVDVRMSTMPTVRGIGGDAAAQPAERPARPRPSRHTRGNTRQVPRDHPAQQRHGARDRPDGQRQDHHAVCGTQRNQHREKKVITVEDPIEYRLPGINQVQVNDKIELTFARVLRAALRQDPDIILVGEMRDQETAQIGLRAALTGHLVLSTLHTKDAISTPIRLIDMGAPPYMVGTSVNAVMAQRLLRTVCESCAEPSAPNAQEAAWLVAEKIALDGARLTRGRGCSHCNSSGYAGRTGIYELLEITPVIAQAVNRGDSSEFRTLAHAQVAEHTMRHHAMSLARAGRTTVSEVMRVVSQGRVLGCRISSTRGAIRAASWCRVRSSPPTAARWQTSSSIPASPRSRSNSSGERRQRRETDRWRRISPGRKEAAERGRDDCSHARCIRCSRRACRSCARWAGCRNRRPIRHWRR